jgi:hypothetical protein
LDAGSGWARFIRQTNRKLGFFSRHFPGRLAMMLDNVYYGIKTARGNGS